MEFLSSLLREDELWNQGTFLYFQLGEFNFTL